MFPIGSKMMILSDQSDIDMKRIFAFLLVLSLFLVSCSDPSEYIERRSNSSFFVPKNGKSYTLCSESISPKTLSDEFGKTKDGLAFYEIAGADSGEFIATGDDSFRRVFVSEDSKEPSIKDFTNPSVSICSITESGYISADTVLTDKSLIADIIASLDSEKADAPYGNSLVKIVPLRFESEKYISLYYYLYAYISTDGKYILCDEGKNISVDASFVLGKVL